MGDTFFSETFSPFFLNSHRTIMTEQSGGNGFLAAQEVFTPKIVVIGAGGGGCNVVTKMVNLEVKHVDFVACNTDRKALNSSKAHVKVELGQNLTRGLGAGANPEIGTKAAEESMEEIETLIAQCHMLFIVAGMGGGTGTGAAPVIGRLARKHNILTVGLVTTPFGFEGVPRMKIALEGIERLRQYTDTLLIIPNDKLLSATSQTTTFMEAFHLVDEVLSNAIQGITDLTTHVGEINLDFADVQTIMGGMGKAVIGKGISSGEDRVIRATENAIASPLMQDTDIRGAKGILVHVVGNAETGLLEVNEALSTIEDLADEDATLVFGLTLLESMQENIAVTVIATGIPE